MALNRKGSLLITSAFLAAIALIGSSGRQAVSARTEFISNDRIAAFASFESPLDPSVGEICAWPGYGTPGLAAAPQQAGSGAATQTDWPLAGLVSTGPRVGTRAGMFDREPLRFIHDPNPAFAAIAVNAETDMVIVADENHGRIFEYSRRDNTRPGGPPTRPRRVIQGLATYAEMPCAVYLDPKTLQVAVLNNDTQNWMPVFSREAQGDAEPDRFLATPQSTWGIAADEIRQELFITVEGPSAVIVYRKTAQGTEAPLRILHGEATEIANPTGIAVDTKNNLLFVANHGFRGRSAGPPGPPLPYEGWRQRWEASMARSGMHSFVGMAAGRGGSYGQFDLPSITIYALSASGNTAPLRVIRGPRTQLNWPHHLAVDEGRGELFVANDAGDSVLVFRITDNGDVAPTRVIRGPRTGILHPAGIALDVTNGELWVANLGNYTVTVYPITANGDVAPVRTIRAGPEGGRYNMMGNPGAVAYDSTRQEILVPN